MAKRKPRIFKMDPVKAQIAAFAGDDLSQIPPEKIAAAEKVLREVQDGETKGSQKV